MASSRYASTFRALRLWSLCHASPLAGAPDSSVSLTSDMVARSSCTLFPSAYRHAPRNIMEGEHEDRVCHQWPHTEPCIGNDIGKHSEYHHHGQLACILNCFCQGLAAPPTPVDNFLALPVSWAMHAQSSPLLPSLAPICSHLLSITCIPLRTHLPLVVSQLQHILSILEVIRIWAPLRPSFLLHPKFSQWNRAPL